MVNILQGFDQVNKPAETKLRIIHSISEFIAVKRHIGTQLILIKGYIRDHENSLAHLLQDSMIEADTQPFDPNKTDVLPKYEEHVDSIQISSTDLTLPRLEIIIGEIFNILDSFTSEILPEGTVFTRENREARMNRLGLCLKIMREFCLPEFLEPYKENWTSILNNLRILCHYIVETDISRISGVHQYTN